MALKYFTREPLLNGTAQYCCPPGTSYFKYLKYHLLSYKTSCRIEHVNQTEPQPSVSVPWLYPDYISLCSHQLSNGGNLANLKRTSLFSPSWVPKRFYNVGPRNLKFVSSTNRQRLKPTFGPSSSQV